MNFLVQPLGVKYPINCWEKNLSDAYWLFMTTKTHTLLGTVSQIRFVDSDIVELEIDI